MAVSDHRREQLSTTYETWYCCQYNPPVRRINCGQDPDRLTSGHQCWWYLSTHKKEVYTIGQEIWNLILAMKQDICWTHLFFFKWALIESSVKMQVTVFVESIACSNVWTVIHLTFINFLAVIVQEQYINRYILLYI